MAAVPEVVARVLGEPSFRERAQSVADEMTALPPVTDAVGLLEQVAQR